MAPRLTTASGDPLAPLGLGAREDRDPRCVALAAARGINFFFFYHLGGGRFAAEVGNAAARARSEMAIASGSGSRDPGALRSVLDGYLEALCSDYIDFFFVEYVRPDEDLEGLLGSDGPVAELARWRDSGLIRYVGVSAHDRSVSCRLAADPRIDVLMHRYNMAHRKAAIDVFPACERHGVAVIAFTATRWGTLMAGHPDWPDAAPGAADCYRFCIAHPAIDVTLGAPLSTAELEEDLAALETPRMTERERSTWKRYGDLIYGDGTDAFETEWP